MISDFLEQGKPVLFLDTQSEHNDALIEHVSFVPGHQTAARLYNNANSGRGFEWLEVTEIHRFNTYGELTDEHVDDFMQQVVDALASSSVQSAENSTLQDAQDIQLPSNIPEGLPRLPIKYEYNFTISDNFVSQFPDLVQLNVNNDVADLYIDGGVNEDDLRNAFTLQTSDNAHLITAAYSEEIYLFHDNTPANDGGGTYYILGNAQIFSTPLGPFPSPDDLNSDNASCGSFDFSNGSFTGSYAGPYQSQWDIKWTLDPQNDALTHFVTPITSSPQNLNGSDTVTISNAASIGFSGASGTGSYSYTVSNTTTITDWAYVNNSGGLVQEWVWTSQNPDGPASLIDSETISDSETHTNIPTNTSFWNVSDFASAQSDATGTNTLNTSQLQIFSSYGWSFPDENSSDNLPAPTQMSLDFEGVVQVDASQFIDDGYCIPSWQISAGIRSKIQKSYTLDFTKIKTGS